ncbi:MAG: M14-type cytosolic carboxypeptidase [Pirellulales bacterium]
MRECLPLLLCLLPVVVQAEPLTVASDFEGASVRVFSIDAAERSISFTPGGDANRGWPCWWYFRVDGLTPGETLTLRLQGSQSITNKPGAKPLSPTWAMPVHANWSTDGKSWQVTAPGKKEGETMTYTLAATAPSVFVAWGPPCTPQTAAAWVREWSERSPHAKAEELCKSREGRTVPMLHVMEGELAREKRLGVWVQARQHAWESGSSWVARGFGDWLVGDSAEAAWLRQHAEVFLVPIMDVDNTATGNGGKDAQPHDHNRDWSDMPHWNETAAAMMKVKELIAERRMDLFLDLHNPAPGDPTFFYILDASLHPPESVALRDRFVATAYGRISKIKPLVPMSNKPKITGPNYHPLWKQISANWVSMNGNRQTVSVCLETIWNYKNCNTESYLAVGANLAAASQEFLKGR